MPDTPRRERMYGHVYQSCLKRGDDPDTAKAKASGVVETDTAKWKAGWRPKNPTWKKRRRAAMQAATKSAHDGFLKAAGVQRLKRLVTARRKGKPVQAAIETASDKIKRRGSRYTRDVMEEGHMSAARALHPSPPLSAGSNLASYEDKTRHHFTSMRR